MRSLIGTSMPLDIHIINVQNAHKKVIMKISYLHPKIKISDVEQNICDFYSSIYRNLSERLSFVFRTMTMSEAKLFGEYNGKENVNRRFPPGRNTRRNCRWQSS